MNPFEIYFNDLNPETQCNLLESWNTTVEDENWDNIPLCVIERYEEEEGKIL